MKINGLASTNFSAFQIFVIIIINFKIIKKNQKFAHTNFSVNDATR